MQVVTLGQSLKIPLVKQPCMLVNHKSVAFEAFRYPQVQVERSDQEDPAEQKKECPALDVEQRFFHQYQEQEHNQKTEQKQRPVS